MSFRLATFNAENFDLAPEAEGRFARRLAALRPLLARLDADVLCLQEIAAPRPRPGAPRGFEPLDRLLADTPYAARHRATSMRPGSGRPADVHNLAVVSRYPIAEIRHIHHDFVPEWTLDPPLADADEPVRAQFDRPLLYVRLATDDGPLHVLNLHLRAPRAAFLPGEKAHGAWTSSAGWAKGMFLAAQLRQAQALEARLLVEDIFDADTEARIAVCGDFNADSYETPTRILCATPDDLADGAFADRQLARLEARVAADRRHTVIHAGRRVLLDHILASPALAGACHRVDILNEDLLDEATTLDEVDGSLHAPIVATFV